MNDETFRLARFSLFNIHPKTAFTISESPTYTCANAVEAYRCPQCPFETFHFSNLLGHVRGGHKQETEREVQYQCLFCSFITHSKYIIMKHMHGACTKEKKEIISKMEKKTNSFVTLYKCHKCPARCLSENILELHLFQHNLNDWIEHDHSRWTYYQYYSALNASLALSIEHDHCQITYAHKPRKTTRKRTRRNSKENKPSSSPSPEKSLDGIFVCYKCENRYKTANELDKHYHSKHLPYRCIKCSLKFLDERELLVHIQLIHTAPERSKYFPCERCPRRLTTPRKLEKHLFEDHRNEEICTLRCDHCPAKFDVRDDLNKHLTNRHSYQWFECEHCHRQFRWNSHLRRHIAEKHTVYEDVYRFSCHRCGWKYSSQKYLDRHVKYDHTIGKSSSMNNNNNNDRTMYFTCEKCRETFSSRTYLRRHVLTKHTISEVKKNECRQCPAKFSLKMNLKKHVDEAHRGNIRWFTCTKCSKRYLLESNLKLHVQSEHLSKSERRRNRKKTVQVTSRKTEEGNRKKTEEGTSKKTEQGTSKETEGVGKNGIRKKSQEKIKQERRKEYKKREQEEIRKEEMEKMRRQLAKNKKKALARI